MFGWNGDLPWDPTDCSRFVQVILGNAWISVERNSAMQGEQFSSTGNMHTDLSKAEVWDLIFFKNTYESQNEITHVWFYMWKNAWQHFRFDLSRFSDVIRIRDTVRSRPHTANKYWTEHFKWIGKLALFTKQYDKTTAQNNYDRLSDKDKINNIRTLKAVNAVIAVLTSTWWDLPSKYQDLSASYAKNLRTDYPDARKLEPEQTKKIYQSVVDMLSYAWKFAWRGEQKKYEELANYLRSKFGLQ